MKEALEHIVVEELTRLGYDLVELKSGGSRARPVIDIRIDRRDHERVNVDDCARASRAIEARLDTDSAFAGVRYVLEVSSPGLDRRLVRLDDWRRFVGRRANVKSAVLGGRVEVEILGVDGVDGGEILMLQDAQGITHRVSLADIAEARLAVHWK